MKKLLFTLALLMSFVSFGQRIEKNLLNDNYSLWRTAEETIRYNQLNNIIYKKTIADNGMVKILFYQKIESDYVVNYWFYTASSNGAFYKIEKTILFFSFSNFINVNFNSLILFIKFCLDLSCRTRALPVLSSSSKTRKTR